jgi:NTE family protein
MPDRQSPTEHAIPVQIIDTGSSSDQPDAAKEGIALCLSGGGYRAMLFHLGTLWRLNELGYLQRLARVSSVSGGSITAGVLGLNWNTLAFQNGTATAFVAQIVQPIRALASRTIDEGAVLGGIFLPGTISDRVVAAYKKYLFQETTLQDLPAEASNVAPRFVINATSVQSGALFRFSRPYLADYRVGLIRNATIPLAVAVAASSAFPPVLSPLTLELDNKKWDPPSGRPSEDLHREPFLSHAVLSDGGVYDNLGLETAWKEYKTILVSDGGGKMQAEEEPHHDWVQHSIRVNDIIDNQVRSLRKRQVIGSYELPDGDPLQRKGSYWGIRADISNYKVNGTLPCPFANTTILANTPTRLKRLDDVTQERLINWGYAVSDASLRAHVGQANPPQGFPYPASKV